MKVGEIFTTERVIMSGTGYRYAPVRGKPQLMEIQRVVL